MNCLICFILVAIIILGLALFILMSFNKGAPVKLDVEKYRVSYLEIENNLKQDDLSCHMTIINADKLLDQALKELRIPGVTMGDRLKNAKSKFHNNDRVWSAHKLRNRIVHEHGVDLTYKDCRVALAGFKEALKDLGAI